MKKYFKFVNWAKVIAIAAFVSTVFGVAFQKGMIEAMGFGGMSGSYQVEEIAKFAVYAYLMIGDAAAGIHIKQMLLNNWWIVLVITLTGTFAFWQSRRSEKKEEDDKKSPNEINERFNAFIDNPFGAASISTVFGVFVWLSSALVKILIVLAIAAPLFPVFVSHSLGQQYINDLMDNDVCGEFTDETFERKIVRQCSQLRYKGRKLMAKVVLERPDGRFYRTNDAFVFISNDGNTCLYSGYLRQADIKGKSLEEVVFNNAHIEDFCVKGFIKNGKVE